MSRPYIVCRTVTDNYEFKSIDYPDRHNIVNEFILKFKLTIQAELPLSRTVL